MHRTIGYLSKRFAHVRPGEGRKVVLTFLYFFLVITAYYVIKPVSPPSIPPEPMNPKSRLASRTR